MPKSAHSRPSPSFYTSHHLQSCHQPLINSRCASRNCDSAASCTEKPLYVSTIRETVVCPVCKLKKFERGDNKCPRCHEPLGFTYLEIYLSGSPSPDARRRIAIRKEVGRLIRRLRSRREMTQAELASLTGIHRTYLSRAERGQVMPSIISLMQIAQALEVDKVLVRVRSSSKKF